MNWGKSQEGTGCGVLGLTCRITYWPGMSQIVIFWSTDYVFLVELRSLMENRRFIFKDVFIQNKYILEFFWFFLIFRRYFEFYIFFNKKSVDMHWHVVFKHVLLTRDVSLYIRIEWFTLFIYITDNTWYVMLARVLTHSCQYVTHWERKKKKRLVVGLMHLISCCDDEGENDKSTHSQNQIINKGIKIIKLI